MSFFDLKASYVAIAFAFVSALAVAFILAFAGLFAGALTVVFILTFTGVFANAFALEGGSALAFAITLVVAVAVFLLTFFGVLQHFFL